MQEIVMRPMKVEDLESALELWNSDAGVKVRNYDDSPEAITRFLGRNPNTCLVLVKGTSIVGTALCGSDGRRGFLYHFMVRKDLRHQGFGRMLLSAVYEQLRFQGIAKSGLVVFCNNEIGISFWEKQGWIKRDDLFYYDFPLNESAK